VAEVGPVANLPVADAGDVDEAVARHIGEVDGLAGVGKDERRALLLVERFGCGEGGAETVLGERGVPGEDLLLADHDVGVAVPVEIDEAEVGIAPIDLRLGAEGPEARPAVLEVSFVETGDRLGQEHQVLAPVSGEVEELGAASRPHERGDGGHDSRRPEPASAQVALVEPGAFDLGEDAGDALAVQVRPLIAALVDSSGEVDEALGVEVLDFVVNLSP
jgi:hypothetical protein